MKNKGLKKSKKALIELIALNWNNKAIPKKIKKCLISIGLSVKIKEIKKKYRDKKKEAKMKIKKMRHLFLVMAIVMALGIGMAVSEENDVRVAEDLVVSTFYDFNSDSLLVGGTLSIVTYKNLISLDAGILTEMSSLSYLLGIGVDLKILAEKFKLKFDLSESVKIGSYIARDFQTKIVRYGLFVGVLLDIQ